MSVKPTTQVFAMRSAADLTVDFGIGQSLSVLDTVEIPTNLDTLSREVLMVQEVDFDLNGMSQFGGVMSRQNGSNDIADFYINGGVAVVLTEVDPGQDPNALGLNSPHFIASASIEAVQGLFTAPDYNPDTASYNSVASADHPLFTSASDTLYLTLVAFYNGNAPSAGTAAPVSLRGAVRIMSQRGKADADTYAAILTGLYA